MKKTLLVSAMALAMGSAASVQAQTITLTGISFGGEWGGVSGTINSNGNGSMYSTDNLFGNPWSADQQSWFDTHSSTLTWSGTGTNNNTSNAYGDFNYTFQLTGNQIAVGTYWDWAGNYNAPILTIYDCPVTGGGVCTGNSMYADPSPLPGSNFRFDGTTLDDFPVSGVVPVPAAVWLMGSGLIGLVGVARRKRS